MFLKSLVIRGFKSLADKTSLEFQPGISIIVGPNGSGKCVDGRSWVTLANGSQVQIRDLVDDAVANTDHLQFLDDGVCAVPDDLEVLSLNPKTLKIEPRRVAACVRRSSPDEMYRVKTRSGREIVATGYHPVFTHDEEGLRTLRADELRAGIRIAVPRRLPVSGTSDELNARRLFQSFDRSDNAYVPYSKELCDWADSAATAAGGYAPLARASGVDAVHIGMVRWGQAVNVGTFSRVLEATAETTEPFLPSKLAGRYGHVLRLPQRMTPSLGRLLGYLVSEGRSNASSYQLWVPDSDAELIQDFVSCAMEVFGLNAKVFNYRRNIEDAIIFSKTLAKYLEKAFQFRMGTGSADKQVPIELFRASDDVVLSFLSALFEGDAHIGFAASRTGKKPRQIEYWSASQRLIEGLVVLLMRFGILASTGSAIKQATNSPNPKPRRYFRASIYGTRQLKELADLLSFKGNKGKALEALKTFGRSENPNLDVIPGATQLVRNLVKSTNVKTKPLRVKYPTLAAYMDQRCAATRPGLKRVLEAIDHNGLFDVEVGDSFDRLNQLAEADLYWDEVVSVTKERPASEWVYDLCVEDTHNFIANSVVVHNSNIIDSISWVLGEQGPRSLRGGKMEDVIFAGTRLRPALGMAEVTMTIDNSAGLLPIDFSEVTISRTLFRNGESEYRLNGTPCRLLDIQEILSDTGVGREQHTIIGQGQLEQVLTADPLQMRGFIEEAAGIAKHRRRKDRALRKIAATEQNLVRLSDLLSEIRRQLRPLREQAEVAKKHTAMAEELSRIRLVQSARELQGVRTRLGPGGSIDTDAPIRERESELTQLESRLTELDRRRADLFARAETERDAAWALTRSLERLTNLTRLASERKRSLEAELASTTEAAAQARVAEIQRDLKASNELLVEALSVEKEAEEELAAVQRELDEAASSLSAADRSMQPLRSRHREAIAEVVRIRGEKAALEASIDAMEKERSRVADREISLKRALAEASSRLEGARRERVNLDNDEKPLADELESKETEIASLEREMSLAEGALKEAERDWYGWQARSESKVGSAQAARRIAERGVPGVVGVLSDLVESSAEGRQVLETFAGGLDSVLVVESPSAAVEIVRETHDAHLRFLIATGSRPVVHGVKPLLDLVQPLHPSIASALAGVFIATSEEEAARLASEHPGAVFATNQGVIAHGSLMASVPAEAAALAARAGERVEELRRSETVARSKLDIARRKKEEILTRLNEADAQMAAVTERVSGAEREAHALERELAAVLEQKGQADYSRAQFVESAQRKSESLPSLEKSIEEMSREIEKYQEEYGVAQAVVRTAESKLDAVKQESTRVKERVRLLQDRVSVLESALLRAEREAGSVEGRREGIRRTIDKVGEVHSRAAEAIEGSSAWAEEAEASYQASRAELGELDSRVAELRVERAARAGALDDMRHRAREEDLERSELKIRARILEERFREEWHTDPDDAATRYGHLWEMEGDVERIEDPLGRASTLDDKALHQRRTRLERDIASIGGVNPLAEQEFVALGEREEFLTKQLADVRASRRDLFKIVAEIDEQIREMFRGAFEDVAREYEKLFAMLFPGGQGRLRLTEPSDPLQTGVEVEARPGGKNLKRLSLLSGGEKALSALAVLFAIFRARPSPFYVLDEVEAALDDVNLHRFLGLLKEFRATSQLLVVTHQKRTMEVADVLYGVSIKPDGASRVIAERLSATSPQSEDLNADSNFEVTSSPEN